MPTELLYHNSAGVFLRVELSLLHVLHPAVAEAEAEAEESATSIETSPSSQLSSKTDRPFTM
jgi:hypothetical protein